MMRHLTLAALLGAPLALTGCGDDDSDSPSDELNLTNVEKVLQTNVQLALAAYSDSVDTVAELSDAILQFEANPSEANLIAAKRAWLVAREPYGQTEVFRFRLSPIDSTNYADEDGPEGDINAWPLGEALIDYVQVAAPDFDTDQIGVTQHSTPVNGGQAIDADFAASNPAENIIGNLDITIDLDLLANTATAEDEHDVISGYHAIEFLLWGQDLNNAGAPTNGQDRETAVKVWDADQLATGGQRPLEDFTDPVLGPRRFAYLKVAVTKLLADLTQVKEGWDAGGAYREAFLQVDSQEDAKQRLAEILTGMGTLSEGELAGERMQIAFSANSQEDEHSCFSDNTHRDIWLDAEGIKNSFIGVYAGFDRDLDGIDDDATNAAWGYSLQDLLIDSGHSDLAERFQAALAQTEAGYMAIDASARNGQPFDVLIQDTSSTAVADTIRALNAQSAIITEIAAVWDLGTVVDPEASACDTTTPSAECP